MLREESSGIVPEYLSDKAVRLAQKMQVDPCIPMKMQL
jgi:hypothetical protein